MLTVCGTLLVIHTYAPFWIRSDETSARVVDSDSGEPVAGADVVYTLYITHPHDWHGSDGATIHGYKTHTDSDGRFTIPSWGPVEMSRGWFYFATPELRIEKEGFETGMFGGYNDAPESTHAFGTINAVPEWTNANLFLARNGHITRAPWDNELYRSAFPDGPRPGLSVKPTR